MANYTYPHPASFPLEQVADLHDRPWTKPTVDSQGLIPKPLLNVEYMHPEIDPWVKRLCAEVVALQKRVAELEAS
jgi:hypothetical protein